MTRINTVPVEELADQHLWAEFRELPRMASFYEKTVKKQRDIPKKFLLNTGHMTFFLDKIKFLEERHKQLTAELIHRKMSFSNKEPFVMPQGKFEPNDWMPTEHDHEISRERLLEKIQQKPNFYRWTSRPKPNWVAAK